MGPADNRIVLGLAILILSGSALLAEPDKQRDGYFGESLKPYNIDQRDGLFLFSKVWQKSDGVSRKFNERSCVACHSMPMPGGSGLTSNTFIAVDPTIRDLAGGHTLQQFGRRDHGGVIQLQIPEHVQRRKSPALFGSGLLEAAIIAEDRSAPSYPDGLIGRRGGVGNELGRFGWKGRVSDLATMNASAFAVEIGLENYRFNSGTPVPAAERAINEVTRFLANLDAPPRKLPLLKEAKRGEVVFSIVGCAQCHTPTLRINPLSPLVGYRSLIEPYSDLLLHDMGEALADGVAEGRAGPRDFRTPPLWGLSSTGPPYLHDGRAKTIHSAISAHGGESETTRLRYDALSDDDRSALIKFLNTL